MGLAVKGSKGKTRWSNNFSFLSHCVLVCKKFQAVFRITSKDNVEYLVQAANDEEREEWTTAIANAIRRLDIKYKVTCSVKNICNSLRSSLSFFNLDGESKTCPTEVQGLVRMLFYMLSYSRNEVQVNKWHCVKVFLPSSQGCALRKILLQGGQSS